MMFVRDAFAAESDDDFDLPAVVRRKASPRPQQRRTARAAPRRAGIGERLLAQALNHPGRVAAAVLLTACAGAIAWNALLLQSSRHPAPLFTHRDQAVAEAPAPALALDRPLPPARPESGSPDPMAAPETSEAEAAAPAEAAPAPAVSVPRPPQRSAIADLIRSNGVPGPAPQPPARPQQAAAQPAPLPLRAPTVRDPIAEMIRLGGPVPTPPADVGRQDGGDLVLSGQRALARLGYGVKVDGEMGPGTRQAIQRFEQDRRLPVTGTFSPRTVRELSALSGIAVP